MNGLTWKCHICGDERPDEQIGVRSTDISSDYDMPEGTLTQNVRHCRDRPECILAARKYKFAEPDERVIDAAKGD